MENLLTQIVNNTELKRSFSIVVSDNKTRFKTWFKPPIQLYKKKDYEIALTNLKTYYSFPNIDRSNNLKNEDDECFKWAITRALNPVEKTLNVLIKNFEKNQRFSIGMV